MISLTSTWKKTHYLICGCLFTVVAIFVAPAAAQKPYVATVAEVEQWTPYQGQTQPLFDSETLVKKWDASQLAQIGQVQIVKAEPKVRERAAGYKLTGESKAAVAAASTSAGTKLKLDFGALPVSTYVVRVIGMVPTEEIERVRKPLTVALTVNDNVGGGSSYYPQRAPYWDDFYAIAELYFNADEVRGYGGTVSIGTDSAVPLYIHSIELHDLLAGLPRAAAKEKPSFFTLEEREVLRRNAERKEIMARLEKTMHVDDVLRGSRKLSAAERAERDERIWNAFLPLNAQRHGSDFPDSFIYSDINGGPNAQRINQEYGNWEWEGAGYRYRATWLTPPALVNKKLNLRYSPEEWLALKPLTEPYPAADTGIGVYFPPAGNGEQGEWFTPLAYLNMLRFRGTYSPLAPDGHSDHQHLLPYLYHALGDEYAARDAALLLARWAYIYPTVSDTAVMSFNLVAPDTKYGRDLRLRARYQNYGLSNLQQNMARAYDQLFPFIKGNQELAQAVGKFLPWVKNEEDVRRLIETRLLQFGAKQSLRFNLFNDKQSPEFLLRTAVIQQDPAVTQPWMEALWNKTWIYPHAMAGLPDYISTTTQRDGTTDIGAVFYTWEGSPFQNVAEMTRRYVQNGGDAKYDLTDPARYAKLLKAPLFLLESSVAGGYPMTIGDVGEPDKFRLFQFFSGFADTFRDGFRVSRDPRYAWIVKEYFGRSDESDEEWSALLKAAARQERNPFLSQQSRVLANWAGVLESGQASDDFRFKRTAQLRVGTGHGHAHADTLDLQVLAHGVRALNDVGWRGSYSQPKSTASQLHNLVEIDDADWQGHSWISTFAPAAGAQFMRGAATPPASLRSVSLRQRDVALIDVDEGTPGTKPPSTPLYGDQTQFDPNAVTPNSYIFDVERVSGGRQHVYSFHGTVSDDFQTNAKNLTSTLTGSDAQYLRRFLQGDGMKAAGEAPEVLQATWRLRRAEETLNVQSRNGEPLELKQVNAEKAMQTGAYNEATPRKFTRVHLLGHSDDRVLVGHIQPSGPSKTTWPFLFVQKLGENLQSVYPAIIEPFAGEPFITSTRLLPIPRNESDALRAVAVEVTTINGHTDLCFSDGRNKERRVGEYSINGRFAYVSSDAKGLRLAHLVEGSTLVTPWGTLSVEKPEYSAQISKVDYWQRKVWLDGEWPEPKKLAGQQVEFGNDLRGTSFTVAKAAREGGQTVLTLDKALDLSYAHVAEVDVKNNRIKTNVGPVTAIYGGFEVLTCTNEDLTKSWKCSVVKADSGQFVYQLEGEFSEKDLPVGGVFRLWELGAGDGARLATSAVVRRGTDGKYSVESNGNAQWK